MKKILNLLAFFLLFNNLVYSQINHLVLEHETLYGISKQYNIAQEVIENNNKELLINGLKKGQVLKIITDNKENIADKNFTVNENKHLVIPKESLYSIARLHNVAVLDLEKLNQDLLANGLQIGQTLTIPNRKKTIDGQARIINNETIFHLVLAKETKYSISKKYDITIDQLENQNPEIVNNLIIGNKLAINAKGLNAKNDKEELMFAIADKQVAEERTKSKNIEVENLKDKLSVQKEINQKVIKVNNLSVNLNNLDYKTANSAEKLKLVLEANKNIQDILVSKLDSLVFTMNDELETLKKTEILDLDKTIALEDEANNNMNQTRSILNKLKKDLTDNRKNYSDLMFKAQKVAFEEQKEYKKKVNQNRKITPGLQGNNKSLAEELITANNKSATSINKEKKLFSRLDSITNQKTIELKRRINKANFYSAEAREYDDRLALAKIKRYKNEVESKTTDKNLLSNKTKSSMQQQVSDIDKNILEKIVTIKNLKDVKNGFYLITDTFQDAVQRDKKIMSLIKSGSGNASFIYDFNILAYYVYSNYSKKLDVILEDVIANKDKVGFNKLQIIKIQNE